MWASSNWVKSKIRCIARPHMQTNFRVKRWLNAVDVGAIQQLRPSDGVTYCAHHLQPHSSSVQYFDTNILIFRILHIREGCVFGCASVIRIDGIRPC